MFQFFRLILFGIGCASALPSSYAGDPAAGISRQIHLQVPGDTGTKACKVVQLLDASGEPREYFMDVDSVVCAEAKCEIVSVRLHFDAVGNYERYELPAGRRLTKLGHQPFSQADHERLHEILSDPYSPLKSVGLDQITPPKVSDSPARGPEFDAMSGATVLSKRSVVVAGAAYTCCTLWHWSHGAVVDLIREMTASASDEQDLLRFLRSEKAAYVVFALHQLTAQKLFGAETIAAVMEVIRRGNLQWVDPALSYLEKASIESGVDHFFRCGEDAGLAGNPDKRVRFLEALREGSQKPPPECLNRLKAWLGQADSYYEVHLLLTLLERENAEAIAETLPLLESRDALVVRRSYRYLKGKQLNQAQQEKLETFERAHPDP